MKIAIIVRGGVVQEIYSDIKEIDVDIIDFDNEDTNTEMKYQEVIKNLKEVLF